MKSFTFKLVFLLLVISQSVSAFELQGYVRDNSGEPLPDALVRVLDKQRNVQGRDYTDRAGFYEIRNLPAGEFDVQVQKFGMKPYTKEITFMQVRTRELDFNYTDIFVSHDVSRSELSEFFLPSDYPISTIVLKNIRKGEKALLKGKLDKAEKNFQKAIDTDPKFSRSYCCLATAHLKNGKTESAVELFKKAIELNPLDPEPNSRLGVFYMQSNDFVNAEIYLKKSVELDTQNSENLFSLGETYYLLEKYEDAETTLTRGMLINPRVEDRFRLMLGNVYIKLGRLTDARDQFSRYVRDNPYAPDVDTLKVRIRELDAQAKLYSLPDMD